MTEKRVSEFLQPDQEFHKQLKGESIRSSFRNWPGQKIAKTALNGNVSSHIDQV